MTVDWRTRRRRAARVHRGRGLEPCRCPRKATSAPHRRAVWGRRSMWRMVRATTHTQIIQWTANKNHWTHSKLRWRGSQVYLLTYFVSQGYIFCTLWLWHVLIVLTISVSHSHTLWNLDSLSRSQEPFVSSHDGNVFYRIKQLSRVFMHVCYVKSFLQKIKCSSMFCQRLICGLVVTQQPKSSLSPTKLCFYLFLPLSRMERGKRRFLFYLFFPLSSACAHARAAEQQKKLTDSIYWRWIWGGRSGQKIIAQPI